jgi:hypothetical protein
MILIEGYCHGDEYIPEFLDDPWANLERVAQVLGRKQIDVHAYADPRRVAQELAEGVGHAYEQDNLSDTLVGHLHDLKDSAYYSRQVVLGWYFATLTGMRNLTQPISSALAYPTFLRGANFNIGRNITVRGGRAYVTGSTESGSFPATPGAFDTTFNVSRSDAFVTKLPTS